MKHSRLFYPLTFICSLVYFASYLTRLNYQVMIAAVAEAEQLAKSTVSLAVTALFISYGLGQLLAGVLGDKAEPETLILAGLGGSVVINFLMPLVPGVTARTALWGINGLFQAMIWPPAVRLLSANLDNKEYEKAVFWMNTAAMIANILMYLLIPALIRRAGVAAWREEFGISAGVGAAVAVLFLVVSLKLRGNKTAAKDLPGPEQPTLEKNKIRLADILPFVIIGMAVQGLLRDGITTWTPSFLNETFGINVADSILLTILLPVSAIVFYRLAAILLKRIGGNEPFCFAFRDTDSFCTAASDCRPQRTGFQRCSSDDLYRDQPRDQLCAGLHRAEPVQGRQGCMDRRSVQFLGICRKRLIDIRFRETGRRPGMVFYDRDMGCHGGDRSRLLRIHCCKVADEIHEQSKISTKNRAFSGL